MKLKVLLVLAATNCLTACSSSPSPYSAQEVAYPKNEVSWPQITNKPAEIDEELLDKPQED